MLLAWLAGCSRIPSQAIVEPKVIDRGNGEYSVYIPREASHKYDREHGSYAYTTYDAPTTEYVASDYSVITWDSFSDCPLSRLGISHPTVSPLTIERGKTFEGKVDWKPRPDPPEGDGVVCAPVPPEESVYVFCSEKNNKAVLICVSQMKDNPALAEEIFKTFRWTK